MNQVTVLTVVVLMVVCLTGSATAVTASPDGHCAGPECHAALDCRDGAASLVASPAPARVQLPVAQLPDVHDLTPPEAIPLLSESAAVSLATRRVQSLAPRSPPPLP